MKIFLIVIGVFLLVYFVLKFLPKLLEPQMSKIYALLIMHLKQYAYQNEGVATFINNRKLQIYKTDSPQIIYFELNQNDDLLIEWRRKYYQQEMIFQYTVRRSDFNTHDFVKTEAYYNDIINKFSEKWNRHKEYIDNKGIPDKILYGENFGGDLETAKLLRKKIEGTMGI